MISYSISFFLATILYFGIFQIYLKKQEKGYQIKFSLLYLYLFLVLCVTILPIDFELDPKWEYHNSVPITYVHVKPFQDVIAHHYGAIRQVVLNIIMTVPFGILLASLKKKPDWWKIVGATFLLSLCIECIQLLMTIFLLHHRTCDITDLITNTLGGGIGFIGYWIGKKILIKK